MKRCGKSRFHTLFYKFSRQIPSPLILTLLTLTDTVFLQVEILKIGFCSPHSKNLSEFFPPLCAMNKT